MKKLLSRLIHSTLFVALMLGLIFTVSTGSYLVPMGKTGRAATYSLASYTASALVKSQADLVCDSDGDDAEEMRAALTAAGEWSIVKLLGGNFTMLSSVNITKNGQIFDGLAANITYNGTGNAFQWQPDAGTDYIRYGRVLLGSLQAIGDAKTTVNATGLYINQVQEATFEAHIFDFRAGNGVAITSASSNWSGLLTSPKLEVLRNRKGLDFLGNGAIHNISINEFWWSPPDATAYNYGIKDSKTSGAANTVTFGQCYLEPGTTTGNSTGINITGEGWAINQLSWDNTVDANVAVYSAKAIQINSIYGSSVERTFSDLQIPAASMRQALERVYGGKLLPVNTAAGWTSSHNGSGSSGLTPIRVSTATGATANSRALVYLYFSGMDLTDAGTDVLNWNKPLYLDFRYAPRVSDAQTIRRVQIKEASTEGQLAAQGLGLQLDNLTVTLETYGASRGTSASSPTSALSAAVAHDIMLVHLPAYADMLFINGTVQAIVTTAANIPSGSSGVEYVVLSIVNGAAGTDTSQYFMYPTLWQGD